MPQDTPQVPQSQPPQPGQPQDQQDPEKMLVDFLTQLEQNVMDLSQRVDVLEQCQTPQ